MENLFKIYAFVFGCLIGSFLNVVILRLPLNKDISKSRSACPKCGSQLKWYHNIPLISFLCLRGKCGFCSNSISIRYPLIELLTGLTALYLFPDQLSSISFSYSLWFFAVACVLICHFFIDIDHQLLLDKLNIYLLALILPYAIFHFTYMHWISGALVGFGLTYLVTYIFYKVRGVVGLGGGDIKLYGILGLYLGGVGIVLNIFLSCLLGALFGLTLIILKKMGKDRPMAFGPFIILVAAIQIFFPDFSNLIQRFIFP